jgi:fructokinase
MIAQKTGISGGEDGLFDVVCLGELMVDFIASGQQRLAEASQFKRYPGGSAGNVAAGVSRLGKTACIVTRLGTDPFGDFLLETMQSLNVGTASVTRDPKRRTGIAFISLNAQKVPEYVFFRHPCANTYMTRQYIPFHTLQNAKILYTSSMSLVAKPLRTTCHSAVHFARLAGVQIAFDVNLRATLWRTSSEALQEIRRLLRSADILKIDKKEMEFVLQNSTQNTGWESIFDYAPNLRLLALTDGRNGSILASSQTIYEHIPATKVPKEHVVDTTGAGDAYMAALLTRIISLKANLRAIRFDTNELRILGEYASAAAAHAVQIEGVIPSLPTSADIERMLQSEYSDQ